MSDDSELARRFHEAYERLAPSFGYKTRDETAVPWEDVPEANKRLMEAVVGEVCDRLSVERDRLDDRNAALRDQLENNRSLLDTARAERDAALAARDDAQSAAFAAMEHYNATLGRALKAENELAAAVAERDTARAALKDAEQQNELLEGDVLRFLRQRNAALERAAAHFHPGPDGADDIIRRELVREWVDEGHDRVDEEDRQRLVAVQRMIAAESELAAAVARAETAEAELSMKRADVEALLYDRQAEWQRAVNAEARVAALLSENTRLAVILRMMLITHVGEAEDALAVRRAAVEFFGGYDATFEKSAVEAARAALATPAEPEVETAMERMARGAGAGYPAVAAESEKP